MWVPAYVINHMKSWTVVHGYCINALLTSMALKCTEKERGDKRRRVKVVKTATKRKGRADEVSGEDHVNVTSDYLPGPLKEHGKVLEISEEFLISEKVLRL